MAQRPLPSLKRGVNKPQEAKAGARVFIETKNQSNKHHQPHPHQDCIRRENGHSCPEEDGRERRLSFVQGYRHGTERCCAPPWWRDPIQCSGHGGPTGALYLWQPWPCSLSAPLRGACVGLSWVCGELPSRSTSAPEVSKAAGVLASAP